MRQALVSQLPCFFRDSSTMSMTTYLDKYHYVDVESFLFYMMSPQGVEKATENGGLSINRIAVSGSKKNPNAFNL